MERRFISTIQGESWWQEGVSRGVGGRFGFWISDSSWMGMFRGSMIGDCC